jgi:uncharacterized protein (TIRG00374 family)
MKTRTVGVSLLAIALFAWFLRNANLGDVWTYVASARADLLFLGFVFVAAAYWTRAVRWQHLLAPIGPTRFRTALRTTVIGFAALALLPARAGDLLRPYLLARQEGIDPSAAFATIVMERVLDLITVLVLLAIYVWLLARPSALPAEWLGAVQLSAALSGAAAAVLLGVMWLLATHPERVGTLVFVTGRVLPHAIADRLARLATAFSRGFAVAREPRRLVLATAWSFAVWVAIAGETWAVTRAFDIDMSFAGSFLLQGLLVIGVAVPTPGAVGGYHEAYRLGVTTFFGAANDRAVAAAIVTHAISYIPVATLGVVFMLQDGLSVRRLRALAGEAREKEMPHTDEVPILRPSRR